MPKKKSSEKRPDLCQGCLSWDNFGKECWFYWDEKKECPNHSDGFRSIKEQFDINPHYYRSV